MNVTPISVFHDLAQGDASLSCIRTRIDPSKRIDVSRPEDIPIAISSFSERGIVDLIGHSRNGFLHFGTEDITDSPRFIAILTALGNIDVKEVRLLGCEVGKSTFPAAEIAMKSLTDRLPPPKIRVSTRDLVCRQYNHAGLRPSSHQQVFGEVELANITDPPFTLTDMMSMNPSEPVSPPPIRIAINQLRQLDELIAKDFLGCCIDDFTIQVTSTTPILRRFEVPVAGGFAQGRLVEKNGKFYIISTRSDGVDLIYTVDDAAERRVRDLIFSW